MGKNGRNLSLLLRQCNQFSIKLFSVLDMQDHLFVHTPDPESNHTQPNVYRQVTAVEIMKRVNSVSKPGIYS